MRKTLGGYIFRELVPPFLFGILAFTLILVVTRVLKLIELVMTRGVPPLQIGKVLALVIPNFLEITVPMAFLLAVFLGLSRLSTDREILALKASGISPRQILLPVILLAAGISLATFLLSAVAKPAANLALKKELYEVAKGTGAAALKEKVFNPLFPGILVYAEEVIPPGHASQGVLIVDRRNPDRETIIFGKVALFLANEETQTLGFKFFDGAVYERQANHMGFGQTRFNVYDLRLNTGEMLGLAKEKGREPQDMSLSRLLKTIRSKNDQGSNSTLESLELHQRISFPFAPLLFGILGAASVMLPKRTPTNRSSGLALCLVWLLCYYLLLSLGKALGERELLPPFLALWLPNIGIGLAAAYLFTKAQRESPLPFQGRGDDFLSFLRGRFLKSH
jgi:lipopolysaccharide export system permease protein